MSSLWQSRPCRRAVSQRMVENITGQKRFRVPSLSEYVMAQIKNFKGCTPYIVESPPCVQCGGADGILIVADTEENVIVVGVYDHQVEHTQVSVIHPEQMKEFLNRCGDALSLLERAMPSYDAKARVFAECRALLDARPASTDDRSTPV